MEGDDGVRCLVDLRLPRAIGVNDSGFRFSLYSNPDGFLRIVIFDYLLPNYYLLI